MSRKKADIETDDQMLVRLLSKKIGPVDLDDVIAADELQDRGQTKYLLKLNSKRVSDGEATALKNEAEHLKQMRLWKIFTETLRYQAENQMFKNFTLSNQEVYTAGKFLLHAISTLEHIVWSCENPLLLAEQKERLVQIDKKRREAREKWISTERGGQDKITSDNKNT